MSCCSAHAERPSTVIQHAKSITGLCTSTTAPRCGVVSRLYTAATTAARHLISSTHVNVAWRCTAASAASGSTGLFIVMAAAAGPSISRRSTPSSRRCRRRRKAKEMPEGDDEFGQKVALVGDDGTEHDNMDDDLEFGKGGPVDSAGMSLGRGTSMRLGSDASSLGNRRPQQASLLSRAVSSIRRSVTEVFFTAAKQQLGEQMQLAHVFSQQIAEMSSIEEDNRQRVYEEAARDAERLLEVWQVLNGPRLRVQCFELERQRRLRILAEYNLWAKQAPKLLVMPGHAHPSAEAKQVQASRRRKQT